jgi:hypothetical protein
MKRALFLSCIPILSLAFLLGCSSFPKPSKENEAVLIIPIDFIKHTSAYLFGKYHIKLQKTDDASISADVPMDPTERYQVVQGLLEGQYKVTEIYFQYDSNSRKAGSEKVDWDFVLQAGSITIVPATFQYTQHAEGNTYYYKGEWTPLTNEKLSAVLEDLSKKENFSSWKLSDRTNELVSKIQKSE